MAEADGLALLQAFGLRVPRMARAESEDELMQVLGGISYPSVLKTAKDHAHKSDVGGVVLGLQDRQQCLAVYAQLSERLGPRALVMEMAANGTELSLGAIWDVGFGAVVLISAGGVFVELFDDKVAATAPFDDAEARRLLQKLRISSVLKGARGQPAADIDDLAHQISCFSVLAASLGARAAEIDVDPLICSERGAFAVDCLIVPNSSEKVRHGARPRLTKSFRLSSANGLDRSRRRCAVHRRQGSLWYG